MRRLEEHFGEEHFRFVETPLRRELSQGLEYWELERRLGPMLAAGTRLTDEDMAHSLDAVKKKSFDYRALNLVLLASVRKRRKEARDEENEASGNESSRQYGNDPSKRGDRHRVRRTRGDPPPRRRCPTRTLPRRVRAPRRALRRPVRTTKRTWRPRRSTFIDASLTIAERRRRPRRWRR